MDDYLEFEGIRFMPKVLIFEDVKEDEELIKEFTITNASDHSVRITVINPGGKLFRAISPPEDKLLSPGLALKQSVKLYRGQMKNAELLLPVHISRSHIFYRIMVRIATAELIAEPLILDFGTIDANTTPPLKVVQLRNPGALCASFNIDFDDLTDGLDVIPTDGTVPPKGEMELEVDIINPSPGEHDLYFWIRGPEELEIHVKVKVIKAHLEALHPCTSGEYTLIQFPPTYYGTQHNKTMVIRNISANHCQFAVLADVGEELIDIKQAKKFIKSYNIFGIEPIEGTMLPFEGRIFTYSFKPYLDDSVRRSEVSHGNDFLVYVDIQRIRYTVYTEKITKRNASLTSIRSTDLPTRGAMRMRGFGTGQLSSLELPEMIPEPRVRVCLYGTAVIPSVTLRPTELILGTVSTGTTKEREVCITNTGKLPISIRFHKITSFVVTPPRFSLNAGASLEVLISIKPCALGKIKKDIHFDLLANTCPLYSDNKLVKVGSCSLPVTCEVPAITTMPKTVFNLGITPAITNEIGLLNERVTFESSLEKPRAAVVVPYLWKKRMHDSVPETSNSADHNSAESEIKISDNESSSYISSSDEEADEKGQSLTYSMKISKYCYKQKIVHNLEQYSTKPGDALIAFPNDRARSLRPWPQNKIARSIFTGVHRYSAPVDTLYTYTREEFAAKEAHENRYLAYTKALTIAVKKEEEKIKSALRQIKGKGHREVSIKEEVSTPVSEENKLSQCADILVPLSPMQLYNIKIFPSAVNLGKVAPFSRCYQIMTLHNLNTVPIQFRILGGRSQIRAPSGAKHIVDAGCVKEFDILCYVGQLGEYTGAMDFVINECHKSEIMLTAQVLHQTLRFQNCHAVLALPHPEDAFPRNTCSVGLWNRLKMPVNYEWKFPDNSAFSVRPEKGTVPPKTLIFSEMVFDPASGLSLTADLTLVSESKQERILNCEKVLRHPRVTLVPDKLVLNDLALNIEKVIPLVLCSGVHQHLPFVVHPQSPLPGVLITPSSGSIPAKGMKKLQLKICFQALLDFSFNVIIKIPGTDVVIKMPVTGLVSCPKVTMRPSLLQFSRVRAGSVLCLPFVIENTGTVDAVINFKFTHDSEFLVTTTANIPYPKLKGSVNLQPGTTKKLYLCFEAINISSYQFYIPIVLNGILGPPEKDDPNSVKSLHYIQSNEKLYDAEMIVTDSEPADLPTITVMGTVAKKFLCFSKQHFKFIKYARDTAESHTSEKFRVQNNGIQPVTVCIKTEEFSETCPFLFVKVKGVEIKRKSNSIYATFEPKEHIVFKVAFIPEKYGNFESEATVYIYEYSEENPFCSITYEGKWMAPTLKINTSKIFFPPVPLCVRSCCVLQLKMENSWHYTSVNATVKPAENKSGWNMAETLAVDFGERGNEIEGIEEIEYLFPIITFMSEKPVSFSTKIVFQDEEGSTCELKVIATADNCILTTHALLMAEDEEVIDVFCEMENNNPRRYPSKEENGVITSEDGTFCLNPGTQEPTKEKTFEHNCYSSDSNVLVPSGINSKQIFEPDKGRSFREFPSLDDTTTYAKHMHKALNFATQWLREYALHCSYSVSIPEGLTVMEDGTEGIIGQPRIIYDVIANLAGKRVLTYFPKRMLLDDHVERILQLHKIYVHLLMFLSTQGGSVAHINPKYLFNYQDYIVFMETNNPSTETNKNDELNKKKIDLLQFDKFTSLCTQAWLDVILQLHKVFCLSKITVPSVNKMAKCLLLNMCNESEISSESTNSLDEGKETENREEAPATNTIYSIPEHTLLAWMNAHFSAQREVLWGDEKFIPPRRSVTNFSSDLKDSLVLGALTASHCQYLVPLFLKKMFSSPVNVAELYHNARILVDAWEAVGIGFSVTAENIVHSAPPFTVGLLTYLYDFLPSLFPKETIYFSAPLSDETTREIELENQSEKRVAYFPRIIGDTYNVFSVLLKPGPFYVKASKKMTVSVQYQARKITPGKATLILSGELTSPVYARSMAFQLDGKPESLQECAVYPFPIHLYKPADLILPIKIPFPASDTEFEIWTSVVQPTPAKGLETARPWSETCKRKVPRRLFLKQSKLTVGNEDKPATLAFSVAPMAPEARSFWLIFLNDTFGDFITRMDITPTNPVPQAVLQHELTEKLCRCTGSPSVLNTACGRIVRLRIPCCNHSLWTAVAEMFKHTLQSEELEFWLQFTETSIGLQLMQWLIGTQEDSVKREFEHIFNTNVTYSVSVTLSHHLSTLKQINIPDVLHNGTVELPIHIATTAPSPLVATVTLTSKDGREVRTYQLRVKEQQYNNRLAGLLASREEQDEDDENCQGRKSLSVCSF